MLFSKYSKNHNNLNFFWKNVNKQLKSAVFFSEKSKFCLDFLLNKTSTNGDNNSSMKSNPSNFLVLKISNQSCTFCVDSPCSMPFGFDCLNYLHIQHCYGFKFRNNLTNTILTIFYFDASWKIRVVAQTSYFIRSDRSLAKQGFY